MMKRVCRQPYLAGIFLMLTMSTVIPPHQPGELMNFTDKGNLLANNGTRLSLVEPRETGSNVFLLSSFFQIEETIK